LINGVVGVSNQPGTNGQHRSGGGSGTDKPLRRWLAQALRSLAGRLDRAGRQDGQAAQTGHASQPGGVTQDGRDGRSSQRRWRVFIPLLCGLGILVALVYAAQVPGGARWTAFGTAAAVAGAAGLVGGVIGFLFGIPLTPQAAGHGDDRSGSGSFKPNTNLEQVSDWLTKIIIGVGLVQIGHALPALSKLATSLKGPLGGLPSSSAFGLGLVIYFALLGFLLLYLWSREVLPGELAEGLVGVIQKQLDSRDSDRSSALSLCNRQLNSAKGGTAPSPAELCQAVAAAPDSTRILIFNQAEQIRKTLSMQIREDLGGHIRKQPDGSPALKAHQQTMRSVIPIYQALIAADTSNQYHRNHGSLGWTYKDCAGPADTDRPTWEQAIRELTTAITIRGAGPGTGWRLYEANRAVCNIQIYHETADAEAKAGLAAQIAADLAEARADLAARPMVDATSATADPDIKNWTPPPPPPPPQPPGNGT
jgi:hypothetical protein